MSVTEMSEKQAKETAKERDDYECRFCGITQEEHKETYERGLHAHHIVKSNDGGIDHPDNLITVCEGCHKTLEHTQADALSRIREDHTQNLREEYEDRINALEAEIEELEEATSEVFAWMESSNMQIHVLLKGFIDPEVLVYTDRDKAAKEYMDYDGASKLKTMTVGVEDTLTEKFRFTSTDKVEINLNPTGGSYFDDGERVNPEKYLSSDIPNELRD